MFAISSFKEWFLHTWLVMCLQSLIPLGQLVVHFGGIMEAQMLPIFASFYLGANASAHSTQILAIVQLAALGMAVERVKQGYSKRQIEL